jgi:4-amino-4-deoxy-L-arabinose transferase-like glycosyltransferase
MGLRPSGAISDRASQPASHGLWALVGFVVLIGLIGRLYGINSSLWLDEFGTLWCVTGDAVGTIQRAQAFHGQTPFYYLTVWATYWALGPSELTLRLPSIISWLAFTAALIAVARRLAGSDTIFPAVLLSAVSIPLVVYAATARAYMVGLALLMCSLWFLERARVGGRLRDAILFGLTGGSSVLAHYLVGLGFFGAVLPLLLLPRLRQNISGVTLVAAGIAAAATTAIGVPQFLDLLGRRAALEWLDAPAVLTSAGLFLPLVPAIAVGLWQRTLHLREHAHLFASFTLPIAAVAVAYVTGTNLVHPRYLLGAYPAAAVLTAVALRHRSGASRVAFAGLVLSNASILYWIWSVSGTATFVNSQDWRGAVEQIARLVHDEPNAVVLYRSGFVEQDIPPLGQLRAADLSPLQSPGQRPLTARIIPLTYRWDAIDGSGYLRGLEETVIQPGAVVVYISPRDRTGLEYSASFRRWVNKSAPAATVDGYPVTGLTLLRARIP